MPHSLGHRRRVSWDRILALILVVVGIVFLVVGILSGHSFITGEKPGRNELMFLLAGVSSIAAGIVVAWLRPLTGRTQSGDDEDDA